MAFFVMFIRFWRWDFWVVYHFRRVCPVRNTDLVVVEESVSSRYLSKTIFILSLMLVGCSC